MLVVDAQLPNRPRFISILAPMFLDSFQKIARLYPLSALISYYPILTDLRQILPSNCNSLPKNRSLLLTIFQTRRQCQQTQGICSNGVSNFAERLQRSSIDPMSSVVVSSCAGQSGLGTSLQRLQYACALEVILLQMRIEVRRGCEDPILTKTISMLAQ